MTKLQNIIIILILFIITISLINAADNYQSSTTNPRAELYKNNGKNVPSKAFKSIVHMIIMMYRGTFSIVQKIQDKISSNIDYVKNGYRKITHTDQNENESKAIVSEITDLENTFAKKYYDMVVKLIKDYIGQDAPLIRISMIHGLFITTFYLMTIVFVIFKSIFSASQTFQTSKPRKEYNAKNLKENFRPTNLVDHKKHHQFENEEYTVYT
uniref:Exported protein n=1 Tax=Parastrongyloides trichosuri TaxID=131310 RepID=A0A0N4ZXL2_PARTI